MGLVSLRRHLGPRWLSVVANRPGRAFARDLPADPGHLDIVLPLPGSSLGWLFAGMAVRLGTGLNLQIRYLALAGIYLVLQNIHTPGIRGIVLQRNAVH